MHELLTVSAHNLRLFNRVVTDAMTETKSIPITHRIDLSFPRNTPFDPTLPLIDHPAFEPFRRVSNHRMLRDTRLELSDC